MKNAIPLTCVALTLAGCSATSDTTKEATQGPKSSFDAPTSDSGGDQPNQSQQTAHVLPRPGREHV